MMEALTTAQIWVLIVISAVGGLSVLALLYFKGGTINAGKSASIFIPEKVRKADPELNAALECIYNHLPTIRKMKKGLYLKALKDAGVPKDNVTAHEDAMYYDQCLGNIIWSGNGIKSFKSILELELVAGRYRHTNRDNEFNSYIEDLANRLQIEADRYLDIFYRSQVTTDLGRQRLRKISREKLYDLDCAARDDFVKFLKNMFITIREQGCVD